MVVVDQNLPEELKSFVKLNAHQIEFWEMGSPTYENSKFKVAFCLGVNLSQFCKTIVDLDNCFLFIFYNSEKDVKKMSEQIGFDNYIFLDLRLGLDFLKKQLDLFFNNYSVLENALFSLNPVYINKVKENRIELQSLEKKLSEVHENLVPLRELSSSGVHIKSKYMLGNDVGGEFVDFDKNNNLVTGFLFSTDSYVTSSDLVDLMLDLKKNKLFCFEELCKKLRGMVSNRKEGLNYFVFEIDSKKTKIKFQNLGYDLFFGEAILSDDASEFNLDCNKKLIILSPGLKFYLNRLKFKPSNISHKISRVIFDETFSRVKEAISKGLGGPDGTMLTVEIEKNVFKVI